MRPLVTVDLLKLAEEHNRAALERLARGGEDDWHSWITPEDCTGPTLYIGVAWYDRSKRTTILGGPRDEP